MQKIYSSSKLCLLIVLSTLSLKAQFVINGEFRPRFEYRHGYQTMADSGASAGVFINQRTRLNIGYTFQKLKTYISIQDVRTWGSQSQQNTTDGLMSIHEAWAEYNFTKMFSVKAGRMEVVYDDQRMFGNSDWTQQGRSQDMLLLKFNDSTFTAHAGFAFNQDKDQSSTTLYSISSNYKALQYVWLNKKLKSLLASFIFVNVGMQSPITSYSLRCSQTFGTHLELKKGALALIAKGYYQMGNNSSMKKISAYLAGVEANYNLSSGLNFGAGLEMLSGQSQTDTASSYTDVAHNFTTLYGTGHKFNGYMDYFYAGSSSGTAGLQDIYFRVKFKKEKYFASIDPHIFLTASDILDKTAFASSGKYTAMSGMLGTELDFTIGYTLQKNVSLQAGYSQMFATSTMEAIKTGDKDALNNWAYLMLIIKPEFLKQ